MPVYVKASRRAKAYVQGGSTAGKLRRYKFSRQTVRGNTGLVQTDKYHKQEIARPGISREVKRGHVRKLRTLRHGR